MAGSLPNSKSTTIRCRCKCCHRDLIQRPDRNMLRRGRFKEGDAAGHVSCIAEMIRLARAWSKERMVFVAVAG